MGDQPDNILLSFGLSDEKEKKYDTIKAKLESLFINYRNPIYEKAKFN